MKQWNHDFVWFFVFVLDFIIKLKMATKHELQLTMKSFGYDLNPFTSKETLMNLMHLHSKVRRMKRKYISREIFVLFQALEKGIDVPKMNDHQLRVSLNDHNVIAGPVIGKSCYLWNYIK